MDIDDYVKAEKIVQARLQKIQKQNENLNREKLEGVYPFCFSHCAIGNSRAGKTFALLQMLQDTSGYKILDRILSGQDIYIISPTCKLDQTMQSIAKYLSSRYQDFSDEQMYDDVEQGIQKIQNRMKSQQISKQEGKHIPYIFIIFDDCISEFKTLSFQRFIEKIATQGRHYNINFWIANQSYKQLPPTVRRNLTHFSIHNINLQTELQTIADELRSNNLTQKDMNSIIQKITAQDYQYLLVCQLRKPHEKYLLNGNEVILF